MSGAGAGVLFWLPALLGGGGWSYDAGAAFGFDGNINAASDAALVRDTLRFDLWGGVGPWFSLADDWDLDLFADAGRSQLFDDDSPSSTAVGVQAGLSWWAGDRTLLRLVPRGSWRFFGDSSRDAPTGSISLWLRQGLIGPLWGEIFGSLSLRRASDPFFDAERAATGLRLRLSFFERRVFLWAGYGFEAGTEAYETVEPTLASERLIGHTLHLDVEARLFGPVVAGAGWMVLFLRIGGEAALPSQGLFLSLSIRG
jgi:hypothetical protein